jgi:calcineurin-like phosphoesterase
MATYNILFLGDVVGRPGSTALQNYRPICQFLPSDASAAIRDRECERTPPAASGVTPDIAEEILRAWRGRDHIWATTRSTSGRSSDYLDTQRPIVRPSNMPRGVPGTGLKTISKDGTRLAVMNLVRASVFMEGYGDPFAEIDRLFESMETPHQVRGLSRGGDQRKGGDGLALQRQGDRRRGHPHPRSDGG